MKKHKEIQSGQEFYYSSGAQNILIMIEGKALDIKIQIFSLVQISSGLERYIVG